MVRFVRWLPFAAAAFLSLALATLAPDGRRPFDFDWEISPVTLAFSLSKANHIAACATLAFLALLAAGRRRWRQSMALTVLVGAGWELAQGTVVGRGARLSDLAPDALGAALGCLAAGLSLWTIDLLPTAAHHPR